MMKRLAAETNVDPGAWNSIAVRLGGCCFHSYEWSLFSAGNNNAVPLYFRLHDPSGNAVSVGFGLLRHKRIAGLPFCKTLSFGSLPAADSADSLDGMIDEIIAYCRMKRMAALEINSFGTPLEADILRERGFSLKRRWEFVIDIGKNEEDLWQEVHSKKRNLIRKAVKAGVRVERKTDIGSMMRFRNLALETWNRKRSQGVAFPEPAPEAYYSLLKHKLADKGLGRLYLAVEGDDVTAGAFFACWGDWAYYMLSSSGDQGLKNAAPDLILWTAITDFQKEGYRTFNLGGVSEGELDGRPLEESGLYHFKIRFSAEVRPCYRARLILRPLCYRLSGFMQGRG
jgi:hypothetical protein